MIGKPGPYKIVESNDDGDVDEPINAPVRHYSCSHYKTCLNITAALNWDSFTCRGCSGEINEALNWQAHIAQKKDGIANRICEIPPLDPHETEEGDQRIVSIAGKK